MYAKMDYINLPEFLKKNGPNHKVKTLCILDCEIPMPEHLLGIDRADVNLPVLVDLIAVKMPDIKGYTLARGKAVAILGKTTINMAKNGKVLLLLESSIRLARGQDNYVELTTIYNNRITREPYLYATKVLYRTPEEIISGENILKDLVDDLVKSNFDIDKVLSVNPEPTGYMRACNGIEFRRLGGKGVENPSASPKENESAKNQAIQGLVDEERAKELAKELEIERKKGRDNRIDIREKSKYVPILESKILESQDKVEEHIEYLQGIVNVGDIEEGIRYAARNIRDYYRRTQGRDIKTGRNIMKNVLERMYPEFREKRRGGVSQIEKSLESATNPIYRVWETGDYIVPKEDEKFYSKIVEEREVIYVGLIDEILGLKGRLINSYRFAITLDIDVYSIMITNPYYLSILDNRIPIEDLDKLAMLYNIDMQDKEVLKFRNAAYLHNAMLDTSNPVIGANTIVPKNLMLKNFQNGFLVSNRTYETIQSIGSFLTDHEINNLRTYVNKNINSKSFEITRKGWYQALIRGSKRWVLPIGSGDKAQALQDYLDSGLGIEINVNGITYLSDFYYASKEGYFINKIYTLMATGERPNISPEAIEECIKDFEKLKARELDIPNFSLEERQKDAVRVLHNPVMCLTGPAGSGKTTTAEALVFALQRLLGVQEDEIMFCAPTGKAANRLKEVVKKPTRTIHSLFLVGGENYSLIDTSEPKVQDNIKVLIVDESSMITLDLMYNMLTKIAEGTRVIFLGDIEQLPPIGSGKPFATLLNFAPCVVLNVTKRASDKSGITRNAKKIIYGSDSQVLDPLDQTDDFRLMNENQDNIVKLVKGICNYHLGRVKKDVVIPTAITSVGKNLSPDDIQIMSPVNDYNWGTKNLNKELQSIFNPNTGLGLRFKKGFTKLRLDGKVEREDWIVDFRVGDRVIHLENQNKAIRLKEESKGVFSGIPDSKGVMNGDVGKIVGIYYNEEVTFIDDDEFVLSEEFEGSETTIFIAVEYSDVNPDGSPLNFIILYKADVVNESDIGKRSGVVEVSSYDLPKLDLAYALTVHKLQGSQAKLIICVFYDIGFGDFISRNMIYTAITRAEKGVYLLGDVIGNNTVIMKGRKVEQTSKRTTLADKMY